MSSANAPYPYYNGIPYNKAFFETSGTGLSRTQANALYLQKTIPDTATAVENFAGGITTSSIDTKTTAANLDIGATSLGNINIGTSVFRVTDITIGGFNTSVVVPNRFVTAEVDCTNGSGALTIANSMVDGTVDIANNLSAGSIYIGGGTNRLNASVIHIGDGNNLPAGANLHLNNGTTNASNTAIMNGATTSGTCNIMTGATTSGIVNICTGTGATQSGKVNIGTGTTTGAITIGNSANITSFASPIALPYSPALITATNMLGYTIYASFGSVAIVSGTNTIVMSRQVAVSGYYLINWTIQYSDAVVPTVYYSNVASTTTAVLKSPTLTASMWGNASLGAPGGTPFQSTSGSFVIGIPASNYINLLLWFTGTGALNTNCGYLAITRIA